MALRKACTAAVLATAAVVAAALSAARPAVAAPTGAPPATAALRAASGVARELPERKKVYCRCPRPPLAFVPLEVLLKAPRPAQPSRNCSARKTGAPRRPVLPDDRCFPKTGANR